MSETIIIEAYQKARAALTDYTNLCAKNGKAVNPRASEALFELYADNNIDGMNKFSLKYLQLLTNISKKN